MGLSRNTPAPRDVLRTEYMNQLDQIEIEGGDPSRAPHSSKFGVKRWAVFEAAVNGGRKIDGFTGAGGGRAPSYMEMVNG